MEWQNELGKVRIWQEDLGLSMGMARRPRQEYGDCKKTQAKVWRFHYMYGYGQNSCTEGLGQSMDIARRPEQEYGDGKKTWESRVK